MERNIFKLKVIQACIGFMPASAIWILYFADVANSIALGTAVFTVGMFAAAFLDIPTGVLSDRCGRRLAGVLGVGALALGVLGYAVSTNWQMLFVSALFDGLGMATLSGNNAALLHETLVALKREDEFGHHWGRIQGWMHWLAIPAAVVGSLLATIDLRIAVVLSVPTLVIATTLACTLREPDRHVDKAEPLRGHVGQAVGLVRSNRRLRYITAGAVLTGGVGMALFSIRPLWIEDVWPVWALGAARAGSALFAAVGAWWAGRIIQRFGPVKTIACSQVVSSAFDVGALASGSVVAPAILTSASTVFGVCSAADNTLLQREFSDSQRATMASFVSVGTRAAFAFASLLFAVFASGHTVAALIIGEIVLCFAAGLYLPAARVQLKRRREVSVPA